MSDYRAVDPRFGTLADFDALVSAAHARGLHVILRRAVTNRTPGERGVVLRIGAATR